MTIDVTSGMVETSIPRPADDGHSILNGTITNGPITYELDGRQYVVAAAGDILWAFVLNEPATK